MCWRRESSNFHHFCVEKKYEIIAGVKYYRDKMIDLHFPQLCREYRDIFPAASVESPAMVLFCNIEEEILFCHNKSNKT